MLTKSEEKKLQYSTMEKQSKKEIDLRKFKNLCWVEGLTIKLFPGKKEKGKSIMTYQNNECSTSYCMNNNVNVIPMQEKQQQPLRILNNNPTITHHDHQQHQHSSQNLAIVVYSPPRPQPPPPPQGRPHELPPRLIEKINELGGYDYKFVIEKKVTPSDLNDHQARFSMPVNECVAGVFDHLAGLHGIDVIVIEPNVDLSIIMLKYSKWTSNKIYVLNGSWNSFVERNSHIIKVNDVVEVWTFRVSPLSPYRVAYGFAIVKT